VLEIKRISKLVAVQDSYTCLSFGIIQALIAKETPISVTRVAWSPDGNFIGKLPVMHCWILIVCCLWSLVSVSYCAGVAFTKHLIQLYAFSGPNDLRQHTEVSILVICTRNIAM